MLRTVFFADFVHLHCGIEVMSFVDGVFHLSITEEILSNDVICWVQVILFNLSMLFTSLISWYLRMKMIKYFKAKLEKDINYKWIVILINKKGVINMKSLSFLKTKAYRIERITAYQFSYLVNGDKQRYQVESRGQNGSRCMTFGSTWRDLSLIIS